MKRKSYLINWVRSPRNRLCVCSLRNFYAIHHLIPRLVITDFSGTDELERERNQTYVVTWENLFCILFSVNALKINMIPEFSKENNDDGANIIHFKVKVLMGCGQEWDPNCIHWHRGVSPLWTPSRSSKENTLWHLSTIHRMRQQCGYKSRLHGHYMIRLPTDRLSPEIHACEFW